jgi:hypothetical protein
MAPAREQGRRKKEAARHGAANLVVRGSRSDQDFASVFGVALSSWRRARFSSLCRRSLRLWLTLRESVLTIVWTSIGHSENRTVLGQSSPIDAPPDKPGLQE